MSRVPIYKEGLRFECTGCGECCTGAPGYVWVSMSEMAKIAKHLDMDLTQFKRKFTRMKNGKYSLIDKKTSFDCIFLEDKKCKIYDVRPVQCKTFPWWSGNLRSKEDWESCAEGCEGISEKAPLVNREKIAEQLKEFNDSVKEH